MIDSSIFCNFTNKKRNMAAKDLKDKINQVLDNMSDDVLEDVFKYLKSLTNRSKKDIRLSQNLGKILEEDKSLLERLAQ